MKSEVRSEKSEMRLAAAMCAVAALAIPLSAGPSAGSAITPSAGWTNPDDSVQPSSRLSVTTARSSTSDGEAATSGTETAGLKYPVVLVHGLGENGTGWGELPELLKADGYRVFGVDFNEPGDAKLRGGRIQDLAATLARRIGEITRETGYPQVNVIAHSFGGVALRAYIAGWGALADEQYDYADDINAIIYAATPSYGVKGKRARLSSLIGKTDYGARSARSMREMLEWYGDGIVDLALWFRDNAAERGVRSLSVSSADDTVADLYSANLDGEAPPFVVSHHILLEGYSHCAEEARRTGLPSIIDVEGSGHPLYRLASSFFGGTKKWLKIGKRSAGAGYVILDLVPSEGFNPTKLKKKAVKLRLMRQNGSTKRVKVRRSAGGAFYAQDVKDGMYEIRTPYEGRAQWFPLTIDARAGATAFVRFDPANPEEIEDEPEEPELPAEVKDVPTLRRFVVAVYGERTEELLPPEEFLALVREIRDLLVDTYPDLELVNAQQERFGYTAPLGKHIDALYYAPTADVVDFIRDSTSGGILIEKLQWARTPWPF